MAKRYVADFETTTFEKDSTRVWLWGVTEIGTDNFVHGTTIGEFFNWCKEGIEEENKIVFFHELKFDGAFLIDYLLRNDYQHDDEKNDHTFNTLITDGNVFFKIEVIFKKLNRKYQKVTFLDSRKKLPMKVKKIGEDFKLGLQKGEINHFMLRPLGYEPTKEEIEYVKNDCQIISKALEIQINELNLPGMTIGVDALESFKNMITPKTFSNLFPSFNHELDREIRVSYKSGYNYMLPKYKEKDINKGIILDVRSMYASVLDKENLPYGDPVFFPGQYKENKIYPLYIQHFKATFQLKKDHIPSAQKKSNHRFLETEYMIQALQEPITFTMTNVDMELFFKQYDVFTIEYIDGYMFKSIQGIFSNYISLWEKIKDDNAYNENAMYHISKLMLTNLYGKFGTNPENKVQIPELEDDIVKYTTTKGKEGKAVYTPIASFVTSYARSKTINAAQKYYDRFIYSDTDSIHLIGHEIPNELDIGENIGQWSIKAKYDRARYIKQKTYAYEVNGKLEIKGAGMPEEVKEHLTWDNFKGGLHIPNVVRQPQIVRGGVKLRYVPFTIS